jgi:hypothetical protein
MLRVKWKCRLLQGAKRRKSVLYVLMRILFAIPREDMHSVHMNFFILELTSGAPVAAVFQAGCTKAAPRPAGIMAQTMIVKARLCKALLRGKSESESKVSSTGQTPPTFSDLWPDEPGMTASSVHRHVSI